MENKKKNIKKEKHGSNKTIKETYDEIIDFVLQDISKEEAITDVINLADFRKKKNNYKN